MARKLKEIKSEIEIVGKLATQINAQLDELRTENARLARMVYERKLRPITEEQALKIVDAIAQGRLARHLCIWSDMKKLLTESKFSAQSWLDLAEGRPVNVLE